MMPTAPTTAAPTTTTAAPSNRRPRIVRKQPLPADFENWVQQAKDAVLRAAVTGILCGWRGAGCPRIDERGYCADEAGQLISPIPDNFDYPIKGVNPQPAAVILLLIAVEIGISKSEGEKAMIERLKAIEQVPTRYTPRDRKDRRKLEVCEELGKWQWRRNHELREAIKSGMHPLDFIEQHLLTLYEMAQK